MRHLTTIALAGSTLATRLLLCLWAGSHVESDALVWSDGTRIAAVVAAHGTLAASAGHTLPGVGFIIPPPADWYRGRVQHQCARPPGRDVTPRMSGAPAAGP